MKPLLAPILGGVADAALDSRIPIHGVGSTAVGMFLHNETVKTIGLYQVGHSLAQYIPFIGGGAGSGGITQV
jgi:hypothetical protein